MMLSFGSVSPSSSQKEACVLFRSLPRSFISLPASLVCRKAAGRLATN